MPEALKKAYRAARTASALGSTLMYALFLLAVLNFIVHLYAITQTEALHALPGGSQLLLLATVFVPIPLEWLLAEFLRKFGHRRNPFGPAQSLRLTAAGVFTLLYAILEGIAPSLSYVSVAKGAVPIGIDGTPSLGLLDVTMAVFLVCLAMVIRYGSALKEDSDSII